MDTVNVYNPAHFKRRFVEDARALRLAVGELEAAEAIGVDLEMAQRVERHPGGLQEWKQILALIQIASDSTSVVIDPLRCKELSPLASLMAGNVRKVFLGGGQDAALLEQTGIPARSIVDVGEVALAVFGRREDGMAALSRRIFGLSLDKTIRRTDWLARPLNPTLLLYAHRDAELTLLIYHWLRAQYPGLVSMHERSELDPPMPSRAPLWLREATAGKSSSDVLAVAMAHGLEPERDQEKMALEVRAGLEMCDAPRQINRLLRVAADLGLKPLADVVPRYMNSPSSLIRSAAARAIGRLYEFDAGAPLLEQLRRDRIEDVRKAADASLKELRAPKEVLAAEAEAEPTASLSDSAMSALQQLMNQMSEEQG